MNRSIVLALAACLLGGCFLDPVVGGECLPGFLPCGGECIDVRSDDANCGACGNTCEEGSTCIAGLCLGGGCQAPEQWCDGAACADLGSDPLNCGACGHECTNGDRCADGECVGDECPAGTLDCDGACVDAGDDPRNCGACGAACDDGTVCVEGTCEARCPAESTTCDQMCVDVSADPHHCGGCDVECADDAVCAEGECAACPPNTVRCGNDCIDLGDDTDHCGACATACDALDTCDDGACVLHCPDGMLDCRTGRCVDAGEDPDHCGACGVVCGDGESCEAGACVDACGDGLAACDRQCVDLTNDPDNCGACGAVCDTGICDDGVCRDGEIGHVVLIGHDYTRTRRDQSRLVANAALIPQGSVRILSYGEYADAGAMANVDDTITAQAAATSRSVAFERLDDAQLLGAELLDAQVLLLYAQPAAEAETLEALGELWAEALVSFLARGGVVVALDQASTPEGGSTHRILVAAQLLAVEAATDVSGEELRVTGAGDVVASGMSASYRAEDASTAFTTDEGTAVVTLDDAVVVLHKVFLP